jgi:carbonic anhydrase
LKVCPKNDPPRFPPGRLAPGHTRQDSAGLVRARVGFQRILGLDHERGSKSVKELFQCAERKVGAASEDAAQVTGIDPGELFLVRNVGNIIPAHGPDETPAEGAALEFALAALKVTEVVVCGHSGCGAMSAMLKDGARELPSVHKWLESAEGLKARLGPDATAADVARANVVLQLEHLETYPMVREQLASGAVRLHGWYYDIGTGEIEAWDAASSAWLRIDSDEVHRRTSQAGAEPSGPEEVPMRVPSAEA